MGALLIIPFALIIVLMYSSGAAYTSTQNAQANQNFFQWFFAGFFDGLHTLTEVVVRGAKVLAHFMYPALKSAEKAVAGWFAGNETLIQWETNQRLRTTHAAYNIAWWANSTLRREIIEKAHAESSATFTKNAYTKAPPLPQRRLTQREVDIEFRRMIDSLTPAEKQSIDPKWDWDPSKWRKYLGILPALGSTIVHPNPTHPQAKPNPKPLPPGHLEPLPHTDDHPHPDPGTQNVPGVFSGKDKWARGQIVRLRKYEEQTRRHLGPLATLALPAVAISTLIGLLECRNFGRFAKGICNIPGKLFGDLLGLLLDVFILADICEVMTLVQEGFGVVEGPLTAFIGDVGGALCHGHYAAPPVLKLPALNTWKPAQIAA